MEATLYPPVKRFFENLGFTVKGEIRGCDLVATRADGELVVVGELKLGFSFELLLQAIDRMAVADEVWLAVPATRRGRDQDRRAHKLCRLLGIGLLTVNAARERVDILVEPAPYRPRPNTQKRRQLLKEFHARRGDPTEGGSTRRPIMTAYRQTALACAAALREADSRPRDLRAITPDAAAILQRNVYGWFERVRLGWYRLAPAGQRAVADAFPENGVPEP